MTRDPRLPGKKALGPIARVLAKSLGAPFTKGDVHEELRKARQREVEARWEQKRLANLTNGKTKWGWLIAEVLGRNTFRFRPAARGITQSDLNSMRCILRTHKYTVAWRWTVRREGEMIVVRRGPKW
jgi:hypothetical protein